MGAASRTDALIKTLVVAGLLLPAAAQATFPTGFTDQLMLSGLNTPVGMTFLPDGRLLVLEQFTGRIRLLVQGRLARIDPIGIIPNINNGSEQGLLGIAVDPGWPARPYIYVHYDYAPTSNIHISRFTLRGDVADPLGESLAVDLFSEYHILTDIPDIAFNHNGGTVRFGNDGMLYVSLGEDATACAAQDTSSLRGVILRLDVSGLPDGPGGPPAKSLITPSGNPFTTSVGNPQNARLTWAIGLRNPFRFHVDPATGDLFLGDVGQSAYEEIDWVTGGGKNFGWPFREGPSVYITCPGVVPGPFTDPIAWFDRTNGFPNGAAVIGGPVYHLAASPCATVFPADYDGDYFYAEYYNGFMRRLRNTAGTWAPAPAAPGQPNATDWGTNLQTISDLAVGRDGALWYLRQFNSFYAPSSGSIHRVLGPNGAPGVPHVTGDVSAQIGVQDTTMVHWATHNVGTCAGAQVYRIRDPQGLLLANTPLAGITPVLAPGDSFALDVRINSPAVCDTMVPDTLVFAAHPLDFPAAAAMETTLVRCSTTETLGVTSFTLMHQGPAVRLQWTARNPDISAFDVYRSGPGQPEWVFVRINPAPIPFTNAPSYAYVDGTVEPGHFYVYEIGAAIGADTAFSVPLSVTLPPAQIVQLGILHPNPTEGSVSLAYVLGADVRVDVTVRDLSGRRVRRLVAGVVQSAGPQSVTWDGADDGGRRAPSGLYFIEVRAGNATDTRRVALSR